MSIGRESWANPYVNRAAQFTDIILGLDTHGLSDVERSVLRKQVEKFQETVVELGSGSGNFLVAHAQRLPHRLHVGFELRYKRIVRTAEKTLGRALANVLVLKTDARVIAELFAPHSLSGVYINFPDPWDKRRWIKHRLLTPEYLAVLHELLKPNGFFSYKTDHSEYFQHTLRELKKSKQFSIETATTDLHAEVDEENVMTEFEAIFKGQGLKVCKLVARSQ